MQKKIKTPLISEELINYLEENGISTRLLFGGNIIKQPYMLNQEYRVVGDLNISNRIMKNSFLIGIYPGLRKKHLLHVYKTLEKYCKLYS